MGIASTAQPSLRIITQKARGGVFRSIRKLEIGEIGIGRLNCVLGVCQNLRSIESVSSLESVEGEGEEEKEGEREIEGEEEKEGEREKGGEEEGDIRSLRKDYRRRNKKLNTLRRKLINPKIRPTHPKNPKQKLNIMPIILKLL